MLRKIITAVIVVPLALIIIAFAVANRQSVTVSFDPFSSTNPAYAATLPLFVMIFVLVIFGVIVGGVASWLRQGKWRHAARKLDGENRQLHQELSAIRNRFGTQAQATPKAESSPKPAPIPAISPPAP
jgi:uncharacterized integral membrane protein